MSVRLASLSLLAASLLTAADSPKPAAASVPAVVNHAPSAPEAYVLGPEDALSIRILDADELGIAPYPIDLKGNIDLPRIGTVKAAGLTVSQLQSTLVERFRDYLQHPTVTISVVEYRSQPVSVLGAVTTPGTLQMRGRKSLFQVISEAGGLKPEAGNMIKIARQNEFGPVPLPGAQPDPTGQFSVAEVSIRSIMDAQNPAANISVKPNDIITVPKAQLIYVIGDVNKPGGFPLTERPTISVLEAVSLAEGLGKAAGSKNAKILRASSSGSRSEIPVDLRRILEGRGSDVALQPEDILFIPNSLSKNVTVRTIESMIQIGTGVAIYAHPF